MSNKIKSLILKLSIMAILTLAIVLGSGCSCRKPTAFCPLKKSNQTVSYNKHYYF